MQDMLLFPGLVLSAGVALVGAVLRYTVSRQDSERERRFHELELHVERLRLDLGTIQVDHARVQEQLGVLREEHRGSLARSP